MFRWMTLVGLVVVMVGLGMVRAQDSDGENAEVNAPDDGREIYTALSYGEDVFEPGLWLASATEQRSRTTAQWSASDLGAIAFLQYLHFDQDPRDRDGMDDFFDNDWFDITLSNYDSYRKTGVCYGDDLTLHTFDVTASGIDYSMRYWTEWVDEDRIAALFLLFPAVDRAGLDDYAERLYPDLMSCERQ